MGHAAKPGTIRYDFPTAMQLNLLLEVPAVIKTFCRSCCIVSKHNQHTNMDVFGIEGREEEREGGRETHAYDRSNT